MSSYFCHLFYFIVTKVVFSVIIILLGGVIIVPVGENIKKYRNKLKLTQKQLAKKASLSESAIKYYESNRRNPKLETLTKIADALDIDIWELIGSDNNIEIDVSAEMIENQKNISDSIKMQNESHKYWLRWIEDTDIETALYKLLSNNKDIYNLRRNIRALVNTNFKTNPHSPADLIIGNITLESEFETMYIKSLVSACIALLTNEETKLLDMIDTLEKLDK